MHSNDVAINIMQQAFHDPWTNKSKIVLGIDIGTTQSGVAFSYLVEVGAEKAINRVTSWPGQEAQNQQGKIPTIIWYDKDNKPVSFGAEALSHQAQEAAEDNGWQLAKHFKLHLHPPNLKAKHGLTLEVLPADVSLSQIYADFLGYLLQHTQQFFEDRIVDGKAIWEAHKPTMDVVIAHPNGWDIREQSFLRAAAVKANFASAKEASHRIHFVSEAEASVHFCTYYTELGARLKPGDSFVVCDAGGSTVDTTVYSVKQTQPLLQLEEMCASACVQAGAIFVDKSAEIYLQKTLSNAGIPSVDVEEYVTRGVKDFENAAKRAFREVSVDQYIEMAGSRLNNSAIRVRRGRMTLSGVIVESFFERCVKEVVSSINEQLASASAPVSHTILVGGFGESPYLREQLKARCSSAGQIVITNEATSKAVADGALIWHCVNSVASRVPRYSFGIEVVVPLVPDSQEHRGRVVVSRPSGAYVAGAWSQIIAKGIAIDCDSVSRRPYRREYLVPNPQLSVLNQEIYSYAFEGLPKWTRNKSGSISPGFRRFCSITADISGLRNALRAETGVGGARHWSLVFEVCIRFGRTELEAFLEWNENGVLCTGPANIVLSSELLI
ncbi:hypothetical protein FRC12_006089 [Ceratobasidium sp. 428]|nr:hypothetical protein FRC12_006089 [Ceratobasidium sp. 428]